MAIAFGFGSLYNHSYQPNARYVKRIAERTLDYVAIRDIQCGEEITVNYNGRPGCRTRCGSMSTTRRAGRRPRPLNRP